MTNVKQLKNETSLEAEIIYGPTEIMYRSVTIRTGWYGSVKKYYGFMLPSVYVTSNYKFEDVELMAGYDEISILCYFLVIEDLCRVIDVMYKINPEELL